MTEAETLKIFNEVLKIVSKHNISNIQIAKECTEIVKREINKHKNK